LPSDAAPIFEKTQPRHQIQLIPARRGKAARIRTGAVLSVINTHGRQVVDTWAFSAEDIQEFMSMEHSRASMLKLIPGVGDTLLTNRRRPIMTVVEDTTPGIHDTLIAACDRYRYQQLGAVGHHDNCTDNLAAALAELGVAPPETPCPFNLFMNVPALATGTLDFHPPTSAPGQHISLRLEMDAIVVFSACPQDMTPVNDGAPVEAHFTVR
jgi:uncharacterized protein YcgI (DUF1989 family)